MAAPTIPYRLRITILLYLFMSLTAVFAEDALRETVPFQNSSATLFHDLLSRDDASPFQLFGRQQLVCNAPGYVPCADRIHCCKPTDNCYPELNMCCIKGGMTCGYQRCYQAGAICCPRTGACDGTRKETCCNQGCCREGTTCCRGANTCCLKGETCCSKECCPAGYTCANGKCQPPMPVLELPYTPLVLDETVKNMCLWLGGEQEAVLTYSRVRNDGGKCVGCCSGVRVPGGEPFAGDRTSCDEAPFAKTYEALNAGANLACVDAYENSFQGWWFGRWSGYTRATVPGFKDGSKFLVRVTRLDCATVKKSDLRGCGGSPIVRRDDGGVQTSGSTTRLIPASVANSTNNLVIVPLGDLDAGTYSMNAQLSGSVADVKLWDNMGDEVGDIKGLSVDSLSSANAFQFTVSTIAIGVGLLVETQQTDVNLTWDLQPAAALTSLPTPSAQPSTPQSSSGKSEGVAVMVVVVPGLAAVMFLVGVYFQLA